MCCFRIGALRGEKKFKSRPQNRILILLMGSFIISDEHSLPQHSAFRFTAEGQPYKAMLDKININDSRVII